MIGPNSIHTHARPARLTTLSTVDLYVDIFLAQIMEEMYGLGRTPLYSDETPPVDLPEYNQSFETFREQIPMFGLPTTEQMFCVSSSSAVSDATSIQRRSSTGSKEEISNAIASHPLYPKLLQSYIDCQKVGAPSDIVDLFDEIGREKDFSMRSAASTYYLGEDPELDEFMETYCEILNKYKSDLARPFHEATTFLKNIENQLCNLCNGASRTYISGTLPSLQNKHVILWQSQVQKLVFSDEGAASNSEGDFGAGEIDVQELSHIKEDRELKDKLFRKYSGYISSLKREFSNKKKKVKLPREARQVLLDWWAIHYMWPYPTQGDKVALAESAGLDQKQINNWFINQRKRHWKPSPNTQFDVMESICGQLLNE